MFRNIEFQSSHENEYEENYNLFLSAIMLTEKTTHQECVSEIEPVYSKTVLENNLKFNFYVYSFMVFKDDYYENGLLFIINDVSYPDYDDTLNITVTLDSFITKDKNTFVFNSTILFKNTHAFLYKEEMLKKENGYANIISVEIKTIDKEKIYLINDFDLNRDVYDIKSKYNDYKNNSNLYYNKDLIKDLKSYNYIIYLYAITYFIFILGITYFICFHKALRNYIQNKRIDNKNNGG